MDGRTWREVLYVVLLLGPLNLAWAGELELTMPEVQPQQNDLYLCIEKKIDNPTSIIGFKPKASMTVAHHILIYGCSEPGSSGKPWNCGEMHSETDSNEFKASPVCKDSGRIIYAWAMDAPELKLPDDVAFKIGGDTAMKYLVMQVHYKDVSRFLPPSVEKDSSGVILTTTDTPRDKTAGVYLVAANGRIAPKSVTYMEAACTFQEPVTLHPFAFRVHTHKLGKVVSGYRVRDGQWTEIGRRNPQKPQMFYPVQNSSLDIQKGDVIAARCTMKNNGQRTVEIGSTSDDEMCNFYIMYYVSGDKDITDPICTSLGPPEWNWEDFSGLNSNGFPLQASVDPETSSWFKETKQRLQNLERNMREQGDDIRRELDDVFRNLWKSNSFGSNTEFENTGLSSNTFDNMLSDSYSINDGYNEPDYSDFGYGNNDRWNAGSYNYQQEPLIENGPYQFMNAKMQEVPRLSQPFRFTNGRFQLGGDRRNMLKSVPGFQGAGNSEFGSPVQAEGPVISEYFQTFDDKNGGKGFVQAKSTQENKHYELPGGSGYDRSSSQSVKASKSYSYSSP